MPLAMAEPDITVRTTSRITQESNTCTAEGANVFPIRTMVVFGGCQITFGILIFILSLVGITVDRILYSYDLPCLLLSGWFIFTGTLPIWKCYYKQKRRLKILFIVFSFLGASLFGPAIFCIGIFSSLVRFKEEGIYKTSALSIAIIILSLLEIIFAIGGAFYSWCFTKWKKHQHQTFVCIGPQDSQLQVHEYNSQLVNTPSRLHHEVATSRDQQLVVLTRQQQLLTPITQQYAVNCMRPNMDNGMNDPGTSTMNPPPYEKEPPPYENDPPPYTD